MPNEKERSNKAEGTCECEKNEKHSCGAKDFDGCTRSCFPTKEKTCACDGTCPNWEVHAKDHCGHGSASPKKGEECDCPAPPDGEGTAYPHTCPKKGEEEHSEACKDSPLKECNPFCPVGHPEAKAGEKWEEEFEKGGKFEHIHCSILYDGKNECADRDCVTSVLIPFIRSLVAEARADGFDDGYAHANKSLGAVVRDRMAEAEQRGRLSGIKEMASRGREAIKNSKAFVDTHSEEYYGHCYQLDVALAAFDQALKDLSQ